MGQKHIIQGPDGIKHVIEAPDGATPAQVIGFAQKNFGLNQADDNELGIDYSQPPEAVRARIGELRPEFRDTAQTQWADRRVADERQEGGLLRTAGEGLRSIANGAGMGYADEMGATLQGGLHTLTGGAMGEPYDESLAYERSYDRAVATDQGYIGTGLNIAGALPVGFALPAAGGAGMLPALKTGATYGVISGIGNSEGGIKNRIEGGIAGGVGGMLLGGGIAAGLKGAQSVRTAYANQGQRGAYGAIAADLPQGVDGFADQIAAGASRNNVAANRRTLDILGEEMQRHGGDVRSAQHATVARIAAEQGVTPGTAANRIARLSDVHRDSNLMLGEYPAVAASDAAQRLRRPGNIDADELGRVENTATQGKIEYLANNGSAQSAADVRNALARRQEELAPSMASTLEDIGPQHQTGPRSSRPAAITDTADMVDTATRIARAEYDAAYSAPVAAPQRLQQLPRFFEYLANRAATSAPDVAATIRNAVNQIAVRLPNGEIGTQSLRQMQQGRTTLRGQIDSLVQSGRGDLANQVRPLYRLVTRAMEQMSPQWAQANRRWADMNLAGVAQDLGDAFAAKAGPQFREQLAAFNNMAPEAQDIVRVHVVQKMLDKLDNLGDGHSVSKLFTTDHNRNLVRTLFGDASVPQFVRAVRDQRVAEMSSKMLQNSATHRRGMAQKQMDAETGLVAAVEGANTRGVRNWLLERASQILTERRNRPLGNILTTPISDTAAVARHLHNMQTQHNRLQELGQPSRIQGPAIVAGGAAAGSALAQRRNSNP